MKILYFTNIPSPYRVEFWNQLNEKNDVTVLFNGDKNEKYRNKDWLNNKFGFKSINLKSFALFQLNKILNDNYDVVVIGTYASLNGAFLNILLRLKKIKFYLNADGGFVPRKENILSKMLKHYFISTANYYLSTGRETNKYLEYYGANKNDISIYPFSSLNKSDILEKPITYQEKMKMRKKMGYNYEKVFVSVGSFIHRKGYDLLLESLVNKNYENTCFIIIGEGEKKKEYQDIINKNHITNVFLVDFCPKQKVFEYYKMADIFIFPSREDIWGLVINEAMACGLPIISSDNVLSSKELLEKNSLFISEDISSLTKIIDNYQRKSIEQLEKIGNKNIRKIKEYTIEETVKKHIEIFAEKLR